MQISTTTQFSLSAKIEYQTWNLPCSLTQTKIWTWEGGVEGRHYNRAWGTFCGAMDMLIIFIVVTVSWVCIAGPPYPQICFQWFHLPAVNCALKILLENPEINNSFVFNCMLLWVTWWNLPQSPYILPGVWIIVPFSSVSTPVSYTHLRAHETS